jgi:hypothetical protein
MGKTYWKCTQEECKDDRIYSYKGLCRACTVYKDDKVSKPIQRVRVTESGAVYIAPERIEPLFRGPVTRKQQKEWGAQMKAEKKHKIALRRAKRMMRENTVPEEHKEALESFVAESIGEQVHVHDENCNHEEE